MLTCLNKCSSQSQVLFSLKRHPTIWYENRQAEPNWKSEIHIFNTLALALYIYQVSQPAVNIGVIPGIWRLGRITRHSNGNWSKLRQWKGTWCAHSKVLCRCVILKKKCIKTSCITEKWVSNSVRRYLLGLNRSRLKL